MASWRYVLADVSGVSLGELRAFGRQFQAGVSQTAVASCVIRQDDPLWSKVVAGQSKLKVYDSGANLRLYGPVVTDEEVADGGQRSGATVAITAADQSWELSKRFFATDSTGVGVTYTAQDSGAIAFDILAKCNADYATGITAGNTGTFVQRTVTYLWKPALQAITELAGIQASYEWGMRYVDNSGATPTVYLDLSAKMGSDRTSTVFLEYGTGQNNVETYQKVRSIDQQATTVWALGSGSTLVASSQDTGAESTYKMRREDVVSYGDITVSSLLAALAAQNVTLRKDPYEIVSLGWKTAKARHGALKGSTPRPGTLPQMTPAYGVDYFLGDMLSCRVVVNSTTRVNGAVRVWGVTITIDELGNEAPVFTLIPSQGIALP